MRHILGISAFYHDSAAAILRDGCIVAAAQEERFSRRKNDERFPGHAIEFCLRQAGVSEGELDAVVFYDKPITKFARSLETWLTVAPGGFRAFLDVMPNWLGGRLNLPKTIREEIPGLADTCKILFAQHHQSHAASAFFPSPFDRAAILTVDGVGEYATTTIGRGAGSQIEILQELRFPHSLGLLYSAFTAYCGFRVNSGEYKLMGLAPYGEPVFARAIFDQLLDLKADGSFRLNLKFFDFMRGASMTNEKFHALFGGPPRAPESALEPRHMNVARSIQEVTEEIMLRLARHARATTGEQNLCLAGGVALNCVANGLIAREKIFERVWIQPAAGDAGGALGAALAAWHAQPGSAPRVREVGADDDMRGALLGPEFSETEIKDALKSCGAVTEKLDEAALVARVAQLLDQQKVVGWFQGRMEYGPRALGNRTILGDARSARMQSVLNLKIKFRESFRPFAPIVKRERAGDYFELQAESPYMLLVAPVRQELRQPRPDGVAGLELLKRPLSSIPAVTHVDYSARIQTVTASTNPRLFRLLDEFESATGCGVLVNTSFNVRGEPVVCTPEQALRCFANTAMDALAIGDHLLLRERQPKTWAQENPQPRTRSEESAPVRDDPGPRLKELPSEWRQFVLGWCLALTLLAGLLRWRGRIEWTAFSAFEAILVAVLVWSWALPRHFRMPYRFGMTVAYHIGRVLGKGLLTLFFVFGVTPLGLVLRWCGKDLLQVKLARESSSYWVAARPPGDLEKMF